ncbi:Leu/Phe/Val dehydrogenase [Stakelama tenebrarum]|uniref:Amino acid dehydrogenase n=1 Tax=Stakelama tenebrarum TaxID=2711215 RepID=A0A6G6Y362_9SPHN|nr:amino acid dehydrogenase [Sphingosinithalassobacter tenebrarum]QIG79384.1 amino acid dehydrogenase [Sphingosinithalassobacter tenebrarum]
MDVWDSPVFDEHEQVCLFSDAPTGLKCIVAIHSTRLGPACGGTRFRPYQSDREALDDALRLSRAMSYKSALAGLPVGGGKSVIIGDPRAIKNRALLHAYGRCINRIGASFATGEDVGMSVADVETVAEVSPYIAGTSANSGDPSIPTAIGVMHGLRAVVKWRFDQDGFHGMRVAVQGLGAVGRGVAERLHAEGAQLIVADIREDAVAAAVEQLGARAVPVSDIHRADADVFAPCALGGVITEASAREIRARAVAGAANNQLADALAGQILAERGILFAPDYVLNAGGIISGMQALNTIPGREEAKVPPLEESLAAIHDRLMRIFARADAQGKTPAEAAEQLARDIIGRGR